MAAHVNARVTIDDKLEWGVGIAHANVDTAVLPGVPGLVGCWSCHRVCRNSEIHWRHDVPHCPTCGSPTLVSVLGVDEHPY